MLINDSLLYEPKHSIIINDLNNNLFYYFDYDERNAAINMEFQHFHQFYEILILLAPEANHLIEGNSFHLKMGDMVLLPPYCLHKSIYNEGQSSKRLVINFMLPADLFGLPNGYSSLLKPFFDEVPIYRFSQEQKELLYKKLNEIFLYSKQDDYKQSELNELIIHTKFVDFLNTILRFKDQSIYSNTDENQTPTALKMYEVSSYIHSHFDEALSLDFLAARFYLSPYYLSHQFKKITNFTVSNYIQMTRIKHAQHLLITTNHKITDIAVSCGFTSFSQFNRVFKKINHMSPRDYRKNGY
ncbi:AraC-like DNA-binding protein [Lachnotalea glycerini]|uniref:AraC family transcriptional regulator n=1 Tax=Lachnotalea glycerini TaxID=1763509 RepID=A0A255I1P5_9FIRM|nr:AraC family transcriptional regulator [Lachnotalea glycerini]PXV93839.1 AraC-like DNA-binding protein [Lachnotalea glycerini]RDY30922.1 AraC family transcriptional regulator [Lachnotalea glycerini]